MRIDINPIIWQWGTFQISWHNIASMAAIIVAVVLAARVARQKGISPNEIYSLTPWLLIGGIVGARIFHVVDHWNYYASNPLQIIMIQEGGLAIWGALVGGLIAVITYLKIRHLQIGRFFDFLVPALLIGQIIGRIGCAINGDAWGGPTNLPWGFVYTNSGASIPGNLIDIPTHPYPVYEMIWNGLVLLLLTKIRSRFKMDGMMFLSYLLLYSMGRLILTLVRQENVLFWGLQEAQVVAVMVIIGAIGGFIYLFKKLHRARLNFEECRRDADV